MRGWKYMKTKRLCPREARLAMLVFDIEIIENPKLFDKNQFQNK